MNHIGDCEDHNHGECTKEHDEVGEATITLESFAILLRLVPILLALRLLLLTEGTHLP